VRVARGTRFVLGGAALAATTAAGCGDDGGGGEGEPQVVGTTVPGAPEVEVEAFDFGYTPDPVEIPANQTVNLVMRVTSGGHNLRIEGTDLQFPIVEEGDAVVGALTVAEPGDHRMVCTVPGHEAAGMVATLRVG
jgi:plastocyanin